MGLFRNLGAKAMELMEEDTVYSALQKRDDSCYELLLKASDENYLAYVSAYLRLLKKGKKPYGGFTEAMSQTLSDRPKDIQKKAWNIIDSYKN